MHLSEARLFTKFLAGASLLMSFHQATVGRALTSRMLLVWLHKAPAWHSHRRRKQGVCRGSDTPNYLCGDIDMYIPLKNPNT